MGSHPQVEFTSIQCVYIVVYAWWIFYCICYMTVFTGHDILVTCTYMYTYVQRFCDLAIWKNVHAFIFLCILKSAHAHYETSKESGYDALHMRLCKITKNCCIHVHIHVHVHVCSYQYCYMCLHVIHRHDTQIYSTLICT